MSFLAMAWAMQQGRECKLPTGERMLLVALANAHNGTTGRCDPGQAVLHDDTGLTERHIRDLAVSLVERGLLQMKKVGRALHYRLMMDGAPRHETKTPEASSYDIPEISSPVVDTTPEPSSGNGRDDTGTQTPRYRNSVPKTPELSSAQPRIEPGREPKEPPVGPHGVGTARRADGTNPRAVGTNPRANGANPRVGGNNPRAKGTNPRYRNGFHVVDGGIIDATAEEIADFQDFRSNLRRRIANG